jgi:signal transduction histidine kinase
LPKIFDPLFTTRQIGTGLGLVSCKSIVEKHGGSLSVRTQLGKGSTFVITLPKNQQITKSG